MDEIWMKRSCQIPAFGDWDNVNEMPITQYFESARQAGLLRYSSSSGECEAPPVAAHARDLYAIDFKKPRTSNAPPPPTRGRGRGRGRGRRHCQHGEHVKEAAAGKKEGGGGRKVFDVTVTEKQQQQQQFPNNKRRSAVGGAVLSTKQQQEKNDVAAGSVGGAGSGARIPRRATTAVDEDLYKIPPHLLRSSHRKKKLGFISRCLVLPCAV
ncbi:hypothetical protein Ancab_000347 [Ancistrocladus abbreviatus]